MKSPTYTKVHVTYQVFLNGKIMRGDEKGSRRKGIDILSNPQKERKKRNRKEDMVYVWPVSIDFDENEKMKDGQIQNKTGEDKPTHNVVAE